MKTLFRYLLIGLAAPALLSGCATHKIKTQTVQQKTQVNKSRGTLTKSELAQINRQWNLFVTYKPDSLQDHWQSPTETVKLRTGDCEDISIAKMLDPAIRKSIPEDQLRLSYVHTPQGVPHMVLIIGQGDNALVLDNLFDEIKTLAESGYHPVYQLDAAGRVYQNDHFLESHPKFEKFELILSELKLSAAY
ncbi:transglutaminase-like cysteine peptidase [Sedimenticola sp.]|uniref:transglutaminase-like cysteine peptidase n=1 Tax=Sedimenticola sp. TaxID=1940285 RepID=UPI003D100684